MKNLILIILDGLRRDRLYLCKNLMSIAEENIFFENMFTVSPYTLASLHSLFSGLYPSENGVDGYYNMLKFKKNECKTLFQYFKERDYFVYADVLDKALQPLDGVDSYSVNTELSPFKQNFSIIEMHKSIIWKVDKKPFFVFLHYPNIHNMMVKDVAKKFTDFDDEYFNSYRRNKRRYNREAKKCDLYLKEIFDFIKKLGLLKDTAVIICSDHGVSNGEKKGEKLYGSFVYDYTIKTFCIFVIPEKCKKITYQCSSIDIAPTILELFGIKEDKRFKKFQGKSLMSFMSEETSDRFVFSETGGLGGYYPSPKKHNIFCFRFNNKKIIYNSTANKTNKWEFYDLTKDPDEKMNLINNESKEILEYKKVIIKKYRLMED